MVIPPLVLWKDIVTVEDIMTLNNEVTVTHNR